MRACSQVELAVYNMLRGLLPWIGEDNSMDSLISAPAEWVESIGKLSLPSKTNRHLQQLMDRNNEGQLSSAERDELEALVELSERLSLVRAEALQLLGRGPHER
jgi:hypothetical protein